MSIRDFAQKNICILGYGKEGSAMAHALERYAPGCEITIADSNELVDVDRPQYRKQLGTSWLQNLEKFDIVLKSPGIIPCPALDDVRKKGKLTNSTQIFLEEARAAKTFIIGVTGSKGKSTTSSLIHHLLASAIEDGSVTKWKKSLLLGNIGDPSIAHLGELNAQTICVLELSSYQLMDLTISPSIAVITSIFPEHLDYHGSFEAYVGAKSHIARFQVPSDKIYCHADDQNALSIAAMSPGKTIEVTAADAASTEQEAHLIGQHNLRNIALASRVTVDLGMPLSAMQIALRTFVPLPHRLQSLGIHRGIEWIDDAISTTPDSTLAGIEALGSRVRTIILGGLDRGLDFTAFARKIAASGIKTVILFPGSGPRIKEAIEKEKNTIDFMDAATMDDAVALSLQSTKTNTEDNKPPVVLLSTASPSYGMFKNFEEKGDAFRRCLEDALR